MATQTTNLSLTKPAYTDAADIAVINTNMDTIDSAVVNADASMAIVVNGDTASQAVASGDYAFVINNTHGLASGLYKNKTKNAFPVSGGTADSTVFDAVTNGGFNALNGNISKPIVVSLDSVTNTSGSYSHTTSITGVTATMKPIDIEVGDSTIFKDKVSVMCTDNAITLSCNSVEGGPSTVSVTLVEMGTLATAGLAVTSTEFDILANRIGSLSSLTTTHKDNCVNAINDCKSEITNLTEQIVPQHYGFTGISSATTNREIVRKIGHIVWAYVGVTVTIPADTTTKIGSFNIAPPYNLFFVGINGSGSTKNIRITVETNGDVKAYHSTGSDSVSFMAIWIDT